MPARVLDPAKRTPEQIQEDLVLVMLQIGARSRNRESADVDRLHAAFPFALTALLAYGYPLKKLRFFRDVVTKRVPALDEAITSLVSYGLIRRGSLHDNKSTVIVDLPQIMSGHYPREISSIPEFQIGFEAFKFMWKAYDSNAVWESW